MAEIGPAAGAGTTVRRFALISSAVWVAVLGGLDHLEVMNNARALDQIKNEPYTDEDDKILGDLGI